MLLALPVAFAIYAVDQWFSADPERAALWIAMMLVLIFVVTVGLYCMIRRGGDPRSVALVVLATASVLLVAVYLSWVSSYVLFPADILLWSESDFINDIVKFRVGYPIYSAQQNNESFVYTPGAPIVSYLIARLFGDTVSVPLLRAIQLGFVALAALLAGLSCRLLVQLTVRTRRGVEPGLWQLVWMPALFLVATNSITNPYVHNLHNDALGLLLSALAYWLLLAYLSTHDGRLLLLMALVPAAGFLIKQNLVIWAPLYCGYLLWFDRSRTTSQAVGFILGTAAAIGAVIAAGYLLWGEHFFYWVFVAMGNDPLSPLRVVQHAMSSWVYFAIGLIGGLLLLRGRFQSELAGAWFVWLVLMTAEAVTSGLGFMLNHMGPGSLIAAIWFFAALVRVVPGGRSARGSHRPLHVWLESGAAAATIGLLFVGLGLVRIPVQTLPDATLRYVRDIEREFEHDPTAHVLLDAGSWLYARQGVVMKDRGLAFGNRGLNGTGDFSGMLTRLQDRAYDKILVRNLNSPAFLYDHGLWPHSSGIREALLRNYELRGTIAAVPRQLHRDVPFYFFDEISVLVPKAEPAGGTDDIAQHPVSRNVEH